MPTPPYQETTVEEVHAPNGGLVDTVNLDLLQGDQASILTNFHHNRLALDGREGKVQIGLPTPDLVCWGGFHYRQKTVDPAKLPLDGPRATIFCVQGTNLYRYTGVWRGAVSGSVAATSADLFGNGANLGTWVQYNDNLYYFDGGATRKYWNGSLNTIKTAGATAGLTPPAGVIDGVLAGGNLGTGNYSFVYTYYNPTTAEESNPSTPSNVQVVAAGQRFSMHILKDPLWDSDFTSIRVYRTSVNGATYLFDHQVDNFTWIDVLDHYIGMCEKKDELLGTAVTYDNGQIPKLRYAILFDEMVVAAGNPDSPSTVYWSARTQPTKWPPQNALDVDRDNGDPITGIFRLLGRVYVLKQTSGVYMLTPGVFPDGNPTFTAEPVTGDWGCLSHHSIVVIDTFAYWADTKGICRFNGQQVVNVSDPKIRKRWKGLANGTNVTRCAALNDRQADHQYYRLTVEDPDDSNIAYDLIYDLSQGCWIQDVAALDTVGTTNRISWLVKDNRAQYHVYQGDAMGRHYRLRTGENGLVVHSDCGVGIGKRWRSKRWGGMDSVKPLFVELEYERSDQPYTNGTVSVTLYRDGKTLPDVTDTTMVRLYDVGAAAPLDETYPDPLRITHSVRIPFDADWCRRFEFEVAHNAPNGQLRVIQYRVGYKKGPPMLPTR